MIYYRQLTKQTEHKKENKMNSPMIRKNMTLEQKIETQIRFAQVNMGEHWTRRQAANALWFLGWISDHQWKVAVGEA